jgi:hypothetical protein
VFPRRFHISQASEVLADLGQELALRLSLDGRVLFGYLPEASTEEIAVREAGQKLGSTAEVRIHLPWVLPPLDPRLDPSTRSPFAPEIPDLLPALAPRDLLPQLDAPLGRQLILLVQAGAVAMGLWEGEELLVHKAFKRYVVRGKGRGQPHHLRTRGKSRYGSRLRLQNARKQFSQTLDVLGAWCREYGPFEWIYRSCPVRLWGELREGIGEILGEARGVVKIPRDLGVPSFVEVQRARGWLEWGEVRRQG